MKLATIRTEAGHRAVRLDADRAVVLPFADVGELLTADALDAVASMGGPELDPATLDHAPLVPRPSKVICVGLNYRTHIQEMGRDLPSHPTLFAKFADTLIGARDDIVRPPETEAFDWEVELAVVIGRPVRRATPEAAADAIAGFTILNDVTCRDWQFRTREWLQGKNWQDTTPVGPALVTPDEVGGVRPSLRVRCSVDGVVRQDDTTGDLLFDPVDLVQYVSTMVRLDPGDLIATGTPGGVGHARTPPLYLTGGEHVVCEIEGLGRLDNRVVAEARP